MSDTSSNNAYIELTTEIVSAYVSNNSLPTAELPALIEAIHGSLNKIASGVQEAPAETLTPAVPIKKSITPDFIICLEDGKKFKSLKRHLRTKYDMTPDQYRAKWGLPSDYPMVAPNYASARSELAKAMGLGAQRRKPAEAPAPATRARKPRKVA
jgi:predicted transcriptional regulator